MRLPRLLLVVILGLLALPALHAQAQGSPYSVTVPVADTSDAQRDQAFATALGQVLARVAGGQDVRGNGGYGDALKNAGSLVQKYQYQRAATGMTLAVEFEPGTVRRLVSKLGASTAGIKPPVLLMVEGADGKLFDQGALTSLSAAASARGTNVIYPDAVNPPDVSKAAAVDPGTLAAINQHYHTGLVLLGKLRDDGADWTLLSGGQAQHWSSKGDTEDAVLGSGGKGLVDRLGKQLNVIGAGANEGKVWVSGLNSAMDYANLLATLRADSSVTQFTTLGAQDDGVVLDIKTSLPISALAANLAAGGRLILANEKHDGTDASLRWLH